MGKIISYALRFPVFAFRPYSRSAMSSSPPLTLSIDRFTRQKQSLSGRLSPGDLPRLAEFLPEKAGEIAYEIQGSETSDLLGRQNKRLKCIISGWFFLVDGESLEPFRHELAIESRLMVVRTESDLPPLEAESDDEDYIVCPAEMDVVERIEEEILLNLPFQAVRHEASVGAKGRSPAPAEAKPASPFAKLAGLKKQS